MGYIHVWRKVIRNMDDICDYCAPWPKCIWLTHWLRFIAQKSSSKVLLC